MLKLAMADSSTNAPGGPLCVNFAVPVWLRGTPMAEVFVPTVCPAGTDTGNVCTTEPLVDSSVSVPLSAAPVVFWKEKNVSKLPLVLHAGLNCVVFDQEKVIGIGEPEPFTSLARK